MTSTLLPSPVVDLLTYAGGAGHPDFPCLSRTHAPSSCVPCADFSPWLHDRIVRSDVGAVSEYLLRLREANPGLGVSPDELRAHYGRLSESILAAPIERYLSADDSARLDLRTALVLLAVHEGFSGFIMTGEAAEFLAAIMAPHVLDARGCADLVAERNRFVEEMGQEMTYWSSWPLLGADALPSPAPPDAPSLRGVLAALLQLPLGARAHAVDAVRHLSAHPHVPRTLVSLSRYETRKRGLDVAESCRQVMGSGLVVPASDLEGWLDTWTRRDLLAFLVQSGVGARNSWGKERLAEVARTECEGLLRQRMADAGVIELAPEFVEGAGWLRAHVDSAREFWRVWLAFGTGIAV